MNKRFTAIVVTLALIGLLAVQAGPGAPAQAQGLSRGAAGVAAQADPQLSASVSRGSNGYYTVILENSKIRVRWATFFGGNNDETAIVDFIIKGPNEDQAGQALDSTANFYPATYAALLYDGADRKTVRLEWKDPRNRYGQQKIQEITIFPNEPYIQIDYLKYWVNIVDLGSPGGITNAQYEIYGNACWLTCSSPLGYLLYPESYYNRAEVRPSTGQKDRSDGGSLNYNGYFITGIYNPANSRGYGRVSPVAAIDIVKLLLITQSGATTRRGFELFPYYQKTHKPFRAYLFAVTGGASDVLTLGKRIADGAVQPTPEATTPATRTPTRTATLTPTQTATLTPTSTATATRTATATLVGTPIIPDTGAHKVFVPFIQR